MVVPNGGPLEQGAVNIDNLTLKPFNSSIIMSGIIISEHNFRIKLSHWLVLGHSSYFLFLLCSPHKPVGKCHLGTVFSHFCCIF